MDNVAGRLAEAVTGLRADEQATVDRALREADGTPDLSRLGANAVLAVSVATALAAAAARSEPLYRMIDAAGQRPLLPLPMVNIVSGGAHAGWSVDMQDFLAVPVGATSFGEALEWTWRVRRGTAEIVEQARSRVHPRRRRGWTGSCAGHQPGGTRPAHRWHRAGGSGAG